MSEEVAVTLNSQSTEMESSGVNKEVKNAKEIQSSDVNRAVENTSKMQSSGASKTVDNPASIAEVVSILKAQSGKTQPSEVDRAIENTSQTQLSCMSKTAENPATIAEVVSILKNQSDKTQPSDVNGAVESASEMHLTGLNTSENATLLGESASTLTNLSIKMELSGVNTTAQYTSSTETNLSSLNTTVEAASETQSGVNMIDENGTSSGEPSTSIMKDLPDDAQTFGVDKANENASIAGLKHQTFPCHAEEDSSALDAPVSSVKELHLEGQETRDLCMADSQHSAVSCITIDCNVAKETASIVKSISDTPVTEGNTSMSEETTPTPKDALDMPVAAYVDGNISSPATILSDLIVETATSCVAMEHCEESLNQADSLPKDISVTVESSDGNTKRLQATEATIQPPRKKIKLSKSIKVPVEDVLSGMHTQLCGVKCDAKHNPLLLAVGVAYDCTLRTCLENHLKLSINNGWKSSKNIQDPTSRLRQTVVHMAALTGKYNLLEFMLKENLGNSNLFSNPAENSPLNKILTSVHHFMPASSTDEKIVAFKQMLLLLVKHDCNVLMVKDAASGDTILHVCARRIRDLTSEIETKGLFAPEPPQLQGLLEQRRLYEQFFKEIIHTCERLCAEGHLHESQVLEYFDCENLSGEKMSNILQQDELTRRESIVHTSDTAPAISEDGISVNSKEEITVDEENCNKKNTEDASQLNIVAEKSALSQSDDLQSNFSTAQSVIVSTNSVIRSGVATLLSSSLSVQMPSGCPNGSTSSTVSVSVQSPKTANTSSREHVRSAGHSDSPTLQMDAVESIVDTSETASAFSKDGNSVNSKEEITVDEEKCDEKNTEDASQLNIVAETSALSQSNDLQSNFSTAQSVIVSTKAVTPSGIAALLSSSLSAQMPSGCPIRSASSMVSVSMQSPKTVNTISRVCVTSAGHSDSPALQVDTQIPETEIGSTCRENHSFLCWPNCSIQHHKLIQLLCATPDHNSITTPAAEEKSCSNFRNYLKETAWDLSAVVPDPLPLLCYSVVHLACLLGKHKALDVLSEFGFHPLVHTAITEETPLHMTLRLLQYQPSGSLFLCNSVVSIVKILNRHSHAISLFSAKDYKGDTVLHSLAKMFLPKKQVHESIELVYLFRVFVHFLLKGQTSSSSVTHQILSSSLSDCNKRGESVEAILRRSAEGKEILKYLTGLMGRSVKDDSPGVLDGTNREGQSATSSLHFPSDQNQPRHIERDEPEGLIDFILSWNGQMAEFSNLDTRKLVESYRKEFCTRTRFLQNRLSLLKSELKEANKVHRNKGARNPGKQLHIIKNVKSSIEWNKARMQSAIDEKHKHEQQKALNDQRKMLLEELRQDLQQWEIKNPGTELLFEH